MKIARKVNGSPPTTYYFVTSQNFEKTGKLSHNESATHASAMGIEIVNAEA